MTAILDILDGSISRDKDGYQHSRFAIVESVTGNADARMYNALQDPQLPQYGDAHPTIPGITLNNISGSIIDNETIKVTLSYSVKQGEENGSSNASVRVSAGTTFEEVKTDGTGATMETEYWTDLNSVQNIETFITEVEKPRLTFDFEYTESAFPKTAIDTYHGKLNSTIWNGYAVGTILCVAVSVDQQGSEYKIRMSFTYNQDGWKFIGKISSAVSNVTTWTDPLLDQLTGTKTFDVYESVDFTPLGFTM